MQVRCVEHGRFVLKRRAANNLRFIEMHRAESLVILFPPFPPPFSSNSSYSSRPSLPLIGVVLFVSPFARNGAARKDGKVGGITIGERSDRAIVPKLKVEWKKVGVEGKEKEKERRRDAVKGASRTSLRRS